VINAALKNQFAGFMDSEKKSADEIQAGAKKLTTLLTVICFGIFFVCLGVLVFLIRRHPLSLH
jgi:hypothetical protein